GCRRGVRLRRKVPDAGAGGPALARSRHHRPLSHGHGAGQGPLGRHPLNILTFDIEDWFHILDNDSSRTEDDWSRYPSRIAKNTDRILELLDETGVRATFFCLGWVAEKHPDVVRK